MPNLAGFAALARKAGVPRVPRVPLPEPKPVTPVTPSFPEGVTARVTEKNNINQILADLVTPVTPVTPQNDDAWTDEDWQAAYDERAGILEYVEGLPRAEAERLARVQVFGDRPTGKVILAAVSVAGGRS